VSGVKDTFEKQPENKKKNPGPGKGHTNNPNGRPKKENALAELGRIYLSAKVKNKTRMQLYLERMDEIILHGEKDSDSISAFHEVCDRVFGKAVQAVEGQIDLFSFLSNMTQEEIENERKKLLG